MSNGKESERCLYAVVRKKVDNDVACEEPELLSIHEDYELALDWAKYKCFEQYSECYMYNTDGYLQSCDILHEPLFGTNPDSFLFSTVYYVKPLVSVTTERPCFPASFAVHDVTN